MNPEERLQTLCAAAKVEMPEGLFDVLIQAQNGLDFVEGIKKLGLQFEYLGFLFMQVFYITLRDTSGDQPDWQQRLTERFDLYDVEEDVRLNAMLREVRQYVLGDSV